MVRTGPCHERKRCCAQSECCPKKSGCKWVGKKVSRRCVKERCQLKKVGKCKLQKRCCDKKKRCRWTGPLFPYKCKRICRDVKVDRCHTRRKCCNSKGKKCSFVGKKKNQVDFVIENQNVL